MKKVKNVLNVGSHLYGTQGETVYQIEEAGKVITLLGFGGDYRRATKSELKECVIDWQYFDHEPEYKAELMANFLGTYY